MQAEKKNKIAKAIEIHSVFQNGGHDVNKLCKWAKSNTQVTRCLSDYMCKVSTKSAV